MKRIKKFKAILKKEIQLFLKKERQYRGLIIVRTIADIVKIVALILVWLAANRHYENVTPGYIVSYYILVLFTSRLMFSYVIDQGFRDIVSGDFSKYLLKPYSYLTEYLSTSLGYNFFRALTALPAFLIGIFLVKDLWIVEFNAYHIFLAIVGIVIGFFINFFVANIITLSAFFTKQVDGLRIFAFNIISFLSGEFVPLVFMPMGLKFATEVLPFRYVFSFPSEILLGRLTEYEMFWGIGVSLIWLVVLIVVYKLFFVKAIKKYEAEGI